MSREAADRYATPQDLADDLNRFLLDRPIQARPPSLADRALKWCRRHKPLVATAAVCLVVSVIGLSVSTLLIAREQKRTKAALAEARKRAEESRQVVEYLVQDVFGAAAPGGAYDRSMPVGKLFDRADAAVGERFRRSPWSRRASASPSPDRMSRSGMASGPCLTPPARSCSVARSSVPSIS